MHNHSTVSALLLLAANGKIWSTPSERQREREREREREAKGIAEMKASLLCLPRSWPCNVSVKAQGEDGRKEELEQRKKVAA